MSALLRKKKTPGRTALILDIENGSVGSALAHLTPAQQPKLFAETRIALPRMASISGVQLEEQVGKAVREAFNNSSMVAARLRAHPGATPMGHVERGVVFLHAPWTNLAFEESGKVSAEAAPEFLDSIKNISAEFFGDMPISFHAFAPSAAPILHGIFAAPDTSLICSITGEVTELALANERGIEGYGTFPIGSHAVLRTLSAHGGFSDAEIASLLRLHASGEASSALVAEPLAALGKQFVQNFKDVASVLLLHRPVQNVFVVGPEPLAEWFARALAQDGLEDLFTEGGSVRALRPPPRDGAHCRAHAASGYTPYARRALC